MHTTHVLRGDEWISSVPKHIQLFKILGFKPPKYGHISPIMKLDNGAKRKISKRKDPEAAVHFFAEQGYDSECVINYLMTVAASDFEDWRRANPDASYKDFKFNLKKMSVSGALFDEVKLLDVSKNMVSKLKSYEVYEKITAWGREFDAEFYDILTKNPEYTKSVLAIDRDVAKPRKDIARFSEVKEYFEYMFEELFTPGYELPENIAKEDAVAFLEAYKNAYNPEDDRQAWFDRIKEIAPTIGFAAETKQYKADPDSYKGHAGDLSTVLRIAVTGRRNTPDLCSIMQVLGKDKCIARINNLISNI
jgi:glutamyl-tRNA synthetase